MVYLFIILVGPIIILCLLFYFDTVETNTKTIKFYLNSDDAGFVIDKHIHFIYLESRIHTRKRLCYYENDICKKDKHKLMNKVTQ